MQTALAEIVQVGLFVFSKNRFLMLVEIIASKDNVSFNISFKRELSIAVTHISRILLKLWRSV